MDYRLLVDLDAVAILDELPSRVRARLFQFFARLRALPEECSDYHEYDLAGRRVEIGICAGYAIHYWIDSADCHVKILAMQAPDQ